MYLKVESRICSSFGDMAIDILVRIAFTHSTGPGSNTWFGEVCFYCRCLNLRPKFSLTRKSIVSQPSADMEGGEGEDCADVSSVYGPQQWSMHGLENRNGKKSSQQVWKRVQSKMLGIGPIQKNVIVHVVP